MSSPHVLVLTCDLRDDPHAARVGDLLTGRGARITLFDPENFQSTARVDLSYTDGTVRRLLHTGGEVVDVDAFTAAWWRRPMPMVPDPVLTDEAIAAYTVGECQALLGGLWEQLRCPQIPARESVFRRAAHKPYQLALATELGFAIPETVITTSEEAFLDFHDRHDGRVVTKTLNVPWVEGVGEGIMVSRLCEPVAARDVAHAGALRLCPVIVQEQIPKSVELRVTVVGRRIFAAEIHSQVANHARLDWRRYDTHATPHLVHRLPDEVADRCLALTGRLGLGYGAIDLIVTPDGRYVFLEINPKGQWLWIERLTGLPISEAVCDLLLEGA